MLSFFSTYQSLFDHILVNVLFAASQYVVLRAGVFSLGSAGFAALGAYCTALLTTNLLIASHNGSDALIQHHVDPEVYALGETAHGWRRDAMLRGAYAALGHHHRSLVDGEYLEFEFATWQEMTGQVVSL